MTPAFARKRNRYLRTKRQKNWEHLRLQRQLKRSQPQVYQLSPAFVEMILARYGGQ